MEVAVGGAWYVINPRIVAGVSAVGVPWTGVVVGTGMAAGVPQPTREKRRPAVKSSQRTVEKWFDRFIL
jgi:ribosome recycling factor